MSVITLENEVLEMHAEKGLYWQDRHILFLADLHLGKINHFRRAGIPVTTAANDRNLERLIDILRKCKPRRVIFMGDLFHSAYNSEWEIFGQALTYFPEISFELVVGNHDILSDYQYLKHRLILHKSPIEEGPFILSHEPMESVRGKYNLAGHIHPGVQLKGKGRQRLTLPCFFFGKSAGVLPAFGAFTGLYKMAVKPNDRVYVVANEQVITL